MSAEDIAANEEEDMQDAARDYTSKLREKILFGLSIYKYVTPTMLHTFLGTSTPVALWKDQVLAKLIADGEVTRTEVQLTSPVDRTQTYTVLHLPENVFIAPANALNPPCATETDEPEAAVA